MAQGHLGDCWTLSLTSPLIVALKDKGHPLPQRGQGLVAGSSYLGGEGVLVQRSCSSLLGWERARERTVFPMGTLESSHPPSLSHTSKYTTHNPMVTSQVTSQAQEETPLAKVQPAPQCPGRPFRGRGLAGRPRVPCAARETAPGAAARYSPRPQPRRGLKLP